MLVTRAGDLALEIAAGLSVCLSVWAVRDVSTPWPTEKGVRRLLLTVAAGRLLSRGWLGGCELSELLRGGSGRLRCHTAWPAVRDVRTRVRTGGTYHGPHRSRFMLGAAVLAGLVTGSWVDMSTSATECEASRPEASRPPCSSCSCGSLPRCCHLQTCSFALTPPRLAALTFLTP